MVCILRTVLLYCAATWKMKCLDGEHPPPPKTLNDWLNK